MSNSIKTNFFLFIFCVAIALNLYLFSGLFHTIAFASIIAGSFYPLFQIIMKRFKISRKWAAMATTCCIILTVVLPSIFIIGQVSKESLSIYQNMREEMSQTAIKSHFTGDGYVAKLVDSGIALARVDLTKEQVYRIAINKARGYTGHIISFFNKLLGDTFYFLFQFVLMLIAVYALFMSGDELKAYLFKLSPLPDDQEQKILDRYNQMNYVTLVGNGIGGVAQGVAAGLAFWVAGIPSVFLWTTVMIILAFIPLVGMSIVFIPASIYLIATGSVTSGVAVLIWCGIVSLLVENIFKPKFVGDRLQVNGIVLLFYILAGMSVFGAAGIFYGPILCIVFLTIGEIFTSYYLPSASK